MKRLGKFAACFTGGLMLVTGLCAADSPNPPSADNPYALIVARNVFGLNPPPPPPDPTKEAQKDLPKITPMGIYAVFDHWKVLFKVAAPTKPGQKAEDKYYNLSEGEGQDDIDVERIDNQNSMVTFKNHGIEQELPLVASASAGGAAPGPAAASTPRPGLPFRPTLPGSPGNMPGSIPFGGSGQPAGGAGGANPGIAGAGGTSGGTPLNFGGARGRTYQPPPLPPNLKPEDIPILIEAQRAKAEQEGSPTAPLFPPTALTPLINQEKNAASGQQQ